MSREGPQRHFDVNRRAAEWVKFGRDSLVVVSSPTHLPFSPRASLVAYFSFISLIAPHSCSIKHPPANLWILMTHGNELPCGNAIRRLAGRSTVPPPPPPLIWWTLHRNLSPEFMLELCSGVTRCGRWDTLISPGCKLSEIYAVLKGVAWRKTVDSQVFVLFECQDWTRLNWIPVKLVCW